MHFNHRDKLDKRIHNTYVEYPFTEENMSHCPTVDGVFIIYDERFDILHLDWAKKDEMEKKIEKILKDKTYPKARYRQVFETHNEQEAKELYEEWKKKYQTVGKADEHKK